MAYFIGIAAKSDIDKGMTAPSYILCWNKRKENGVERDSWIVAAPDTSFVESKVIVMHTEGNDEMVLHMANYRSKVLPKDDDPGFYYKPEGMLMWYPCNMYGEQIDVPIMIMSLPCKVKGINKSDQGKQYCQSFLERKFSEKERLLSDPSVMNLETTAVMIRSPITKELKELKPEKKSKAEQVKDIIYRS